MIQAKYCTLEHTFFVGVVEKLRTFFGVVEKLCVRSAYFFGWAPPPTGSS